MSAKILIVEDEADLVGVLTYNLKREGYAVKAAGNGAEALRLLDEDPPPDLVVLDLMLPDISGIDVCRQLRSNERTRRTPVLMLTARGEENDRVRGFEVGADDYVTKPFSVRELMLRVRALLRRASGKEAGASEGTFGALRVDNAAHRVWVEKSEVVLTALEFRLLGAFLERKGRVQTRDALLADVWDIHADVTTRTVDTHVKRLREKLGPAGDYIETVRGVGYRFKSSPAEEG
jgi:two-component system, OmpR family, phosphate regulon response regulator PhoB